jgi:hypothetical protein
VAITLQATADQARQQLAAAGGSVRLAIAAGNRA